MLELVMKHAPQLLENMPDDTVSIPIDAPIGNIPDRMDMSLAKIQQAVAWDKRRRVLSIKYHLMLKDIAEGRKTLNQSNKQLVNDKISLLISHGLSFKE